jgi:hypothetical protein
MTKVILHIGVHKTGTSFIQRRLARNRSWLCERGISYCPGDEDAAHYHPTNHHTLVQKFQRDGHRTSDGIEHIEHLFSEAERTGCHTVLVSSELLAQGTTDIVPIVSLLNVRSGGQTSVIAYMR